MPASTGYGEPVQKLFNFRDGERAVAAMLLDTVSAPTGAVALGITRHGYGMRFNLDPHRELSTRAGRRFAKTAEGDEIVGVSVADADGVVCVITTEARALVCKVEEIPELANPGRGVIVIKTDADDPVVGVRCRPRPRQGVADRRDRQRQEDPDGLRAAVADGARWHGPRAGAQGEGRERDPARAPGPPHAAELRSKQRIDGYRRLYVRAHHGSRRARAGPAPPRMYIGGIDTKG